MYNDAVRELNNIPEIVECHFTTGPYTILAKLYSRDNEHLKELLNGKIQQIPGVTSTETMISLEQSIARNVPILLDEDEATKCEAEDEKADGAQLDIADDIE